MDPNECLENIEDCLEELDYDSAREHCAELHDWLSNGGFHPDWEDYSRAANYYREYLTDM